MTNTVQAWTRVGKGPWSRIDGMSGDAKCIAAMIAAARAAANTGQQVQAFSITHNPNRD